MSNSTNGITENTKLTLPITKAIVVVLFIISVVSSGIMYYNALSRTNERQDEQINNKVEKSEFNRHSFQDSLKFEFYFKEVKKDLRDIKRNLNIKE